ncbi:hypothetical protein LTR37_013131 [Vermiconidia calcicola]|uniref:Uncharacterized protein n=1 Tax=Vermiconidia calcicola TaxID=1690605 RepID=A0ACC3MY45_9PEZI|nr:hypothetical protein LTR37_013131 [Vermiconidia calcicola]
MKLLACCLSLFALLINTVHANTEKVIFLAPTTQHTSGLSEYQALDVLTPLAPSIRRSLPVAFPTDQHPEGVESWYWLKDLRQRQRHEVRICWAATQPTDFRLDVFEHKDIAEQHALLESLTQFIQSQRQTKEAATSAKEEIFLLLRIQAAADFYTTNKTLMQKPPPVDVDIILDPYLDNIFPTSLLPTAAYIVCLAVGSWYVSGYIWSLLKPVAGTEAKSHED